MTTAKENPNKDIDDFIKRVYEDEVTKIDPRVSQEELSYDAIKTIKPSYKIADLLDEYVTKYKTYIPKLEPLDFSSFRSVSLDRLTPIKKGNPYAPIMRTIIRALQNRGLLMVSTGTDVKYVTALDEKQKLEKKLEEVSEGFNKIDEVLKATKARLTDVENERDDAYKTIEELRKKVSK